MVTIKSYTDIEQSKKLAEILSLESADNVIVSFGDRYGVKTVTMPKETLDVIRTPFADIRETTMCWSLAALLGVIKSVADYTMQSIDCKESFIVCELGDKPWNITEQYDNEIDACYEMIIKLNELNLL